MGRSSSSPAATAIGDGATTITFGPERPADSQEGSPLASYFDKPWRPSEIEPVTHGSNGHDPQTGR